MIYFIQMGQIGPIKIGHTKNTEQLTGRFYNLRTKYRRLTILGTFSGNTIDERRLHRQFADARLFGEWFEPVGELLEIIASTDTYITIESNNAYRTPETSCKGVRKDKQPCNGACVKGTQYCRYHQNQGG